MSVKEQAVSKLCCPFTVFKSIRNYYGVFRLLRWSMLMHEPWWWLKVYPKLRICSGLAEKGVAGGTVAVADTAVLGILVRQQHMPPIYLPHPCRANSFGRLDIDGDRHRCFLVTSHSARQPLFFGQEPRPRRQRQRQGTRPGVSLHPRHRRAATEPSLLRSCRNTINHSSSRSGSGGGGGSGIKKRCWSTRPTTTMASPWTIPAFPRALRSSRRRWRPRWRRGDPPGRRVCGSR